MALSKRIRQAVYAKCNGHCAYCGQPLAYKDMQVDHLIPLHRGVSAKWIEDRGHPRGTDDIDNLLPACRMCNFRKGELPLEAFRSEITEQCRRAVNIFQVKMSLAYGLLRRVDKPITFYFETLSSKLPKTSI